MKVLTSVAHAFHNIRVAKSAYTEQGAIIAGHIQSAITTGVGFIKVNDNINLKKKTFVELKATEHLPANMLY